MNPDETRSLIENFLTQCQNACEVARTGMKHRKSLAGSNFYGEKFHNLVIALSQSEATLRSLTDTGVLEESETTKLFSCIETIKSVSAKPPQRTEALKQLRLMCQSVLLPNIEKLSADPTPQSEQVLPMAVVQNTRGYMEKVIIQANGSYEHQWYDACSVMIRRFVETLIIELYEAKGRAADIQDASGNFFQLGDLVDKTLADSAWNLSRETKRVLPNLKTIGDRSAHNRRYLARKTDIDNILPGLRVFADDLLHLAGLR